MQKEKQLTLKRKILRTFLVLAIFCMIAVLGYYIFIWTGIWEYINSVEKIRMLILSLGIWGRLIYVLLQFLQVTFIPIPSTITTLAGILVYGPLQTSFLSLSGILLGSVFAFWLGRIFGRPLVIFMVGKETCNKWVKFLSNCKYSFVIMMLLPIFPDDILCLVAGLTDMSWAFFVFTNFLSRPLAIFSTCFFGSGKIIPYHGWGLVVWAILIIIAGILLFLSFYYQPKIEKFIQNKFKIKK